MANILRVRTMRSQDRPRLREWADLVDEDLPEEIVHEDEECRRDRENAGQWRTDV